MRRRSLVRRSVNVLTANKIEIPRSGLTVNENFTAPNLDASAVAAGRGGRAPGRSARHSAVAAAPAAAHAAGGLRVRHCAPAHP
eukprot:4927009-Pyramimonas_sp.AAC.1